MDEREKELRSIIDKCQVFKAELTKFVVNLDTNINAYCDTNDMLIGTVYKGTSMEFRFTETNKTIRMATVLLTNALMESSKMADIGAVMKATLEKTAGDPEDFHDED